MNKTTAGEGMVGGVRFHDERSNRKGKVETKNRSGATRSSNPQKNEAKSAELELRQGGNQHDAGDQEIPFNRPIAGSQERGDGFTA